MKIILTHDNADFDAVASMIAVHKLYPDALPVLPPRQNSNVTEFLALYRSGLPCVQWDYFKKVYDAGSVTQIILTDTQSFNRMAGLPGQIPVHIIEHHPQERDLQAHETWTGEMLGAVTTLLVERIRTRKLSLSSLEATVLALGIYEDTGMMTYGGTTVRDMQAAAWLLEQGAVLDTVRRFLSHPLNQVQQDLFENLLENIDTHTIQGYTIAIGAAQANQTIFGINSVTTSLRNILDSTGLFVLVAMPGRVQLVARSTDDAVNVGDVARLFGGGGHPRAAAAAIHDYDLDEVKTAILEHLRIHIQPAVRVADLMSYNPRTVPADEPVVEILPLLRQIGHEGYPVLEDGRVVGLLTLRDADRTHEHQLKKATVRHIMQGGGYSLHPQDSVNTLEQMMVESRWGQLPVVDDAGQLIGIVTRTDLIKHWANTHPTDAPGQPAIEPQTVRRILGAYTMQVIEYIIQAAQQQDITLYMVGGVVRDLLLNRPNLDIDFVVEGDAIAFAEAMSEQYGGDIHSYAPFGTAKWHLRGDAPEKLTIPPEELPGHIDFATARNEFYTHPTALPTVYSSSIKLDSGRRDFTINAIAIQLSPPGMAWRLLDEYGGLPDLERRLIRVLHSLSFVDDPTRILRAVRFSERLHFVIEPRTSELIETALPMLGRITGERLRNELTLLLKEREPERGLLKLQALSVPAAIHPDFRIRPEYTAMFPAAREQFDTEDIVDVYWHILFCSVPVRAVPDVCERLLFSRSQADSIRAGVQLVQSHDLLLDPATRPSAIVKRLNDLPEMALRVAGFVLGPAAAAVVQHYMDTWRHMKPIFNGNTLRAMGLEPGPQYRMILDALRDARLDGRVTSEADEHALVEQMIPEVYGR